MPTRDGRHRFAHQGEVGVRGLGAGPDRRPQAARAHRHDQPRRRGAEPDHRSRAPAFRAKANVAAGPHRVSGVDLRGLGFGATLVLVNGRRLPISGGTATGGWRCDPDLGQIPYEAVERIEILKGGASAIYGSDAVAGVVNIITRKNWDGFRVESKARPPTTRLQGVQPQRGLRRGRGERARVMAARVAGIYITSSTPANATGPGRVSSGARWAIRARS